MNETQGEPNIVEWITNQHHKNEKSSSQHERVYAIKQFSTKE
jgi:hypothetical protein